MAVADSVEWLPQQALISLAYFDQFEFPLTLDEWWLRLVMVPPKLERGQFEQAVQHLLKLSLVGEADGYYFLGGRQQLVAIRKKRQRSSFQKEPSVKQFLEVVKHVPWIQAVAITGSLAVANAKSESDIDFMIVTSTHRVWLTRALLLFITSLMGKRRTGRGESPDSWCFNIWTDENHLQVPPIKQSVYTAHEVIQARWCYDQSNVQARFYSANTWILSYLPNTIIYPSIQSAPKRMFSIIMSFINWASYMVQRAFMYPRLTREIVSYNLAYFHPRDTQRLVYTRWQNALRQSQEPH